MNRITFCKAKKKEYSPHGLAGTHYCHKHEGHEGVHSCLCSARWS